MQAQSKLKQSIAVKNIPKVFLHPATVKHLKKGHFWVTKDSFTAKFPDAPVLAGYDKQTQSFAGYFLADKKHPDVKARLILNEIQKPDAQFSFLTLLEERLVAACLKRKELLESRARENVLLVNGESDYLPGLLILLLKDQILIQCYAYFWQDLAYDLAPLILKIISQHLPHQKIEHIWLQQREHERKANLICLTDPNLKEKKIILKEYDIDYLLQLNQHYDLGIYSDMAALRPKMLPYMKDAQRILNLYSYTGAISLFALKNSSARVYSVDLSPKYLAWLDENIQLNQEKYPHFQSAHESICSSSKESLKKFSQELKSPEEAFQLIVCDPPSSSSDGEKRTNALQDYAELLPLMNQILQPAGHLILFLNTHGVSSLKFQEKILGIIQEHSLTLKLVKVLKLDEDYIPSKGFYEGDYLKGIVLKKERPK